MQFFPALNSNNQDLALITPTQSISYADLHARIALLASGLLSANADLDEGNEAMINCLGKPGSEEFWIELSRRIAQRGYNLKNQSVKFTSELTQQLNNPFNGSVVPWWQMNQYQNGFLAFIRKNFGFVIY